MSKVKIAVIVFNFLGLSSQVLARPIPEALCPMVYKPAQCSYEDFSAQGSNSCFARIALQNELRRHGIEADPAEIRCFNTDVAIMKGAEPVAS